MEEKGTARQLPRRNSAYAKQEYWEERFAAEKHYEWLESPESLLPLLLPLLRPSMLVLTVGCGNSELSDALVASGMPFVFNLDFSRTVLHAKLLALSSPNAASSCSRFSALLCLSSPPVGDCRVLFLRFFSFSSQIDKAAMDALMTEEGSVWEPRISVRQAADGYLAGVGRCLKPGGLFIQITFQQPHFRR
ncbi:hypothetical protein TGPRC2_221818 [Toxoplasma gondii TgCatPRC2]|uniref:Methyltransferase domain protein n=1 Tax=Toxoplasma gondii TgCatPRC2 TaxID=1130821 RepID=A0A151HIH2_TOXGO|nr:hypothetical protein TGPRC2_221818 [Toxoplasma gondii TgCatPRC2]